MRPQAPSPLAAAWYRSSLIRRIERCSPLSLPRCAPPCTHHVHNARSLRPRHWPPLDATSPPHFIAGDRDAVQTRLPSAPRAVRTA
eukprot:scaffold16444_cov29-Tisochrysis_lutea.AAC.3